MVDQTVATERFAELYRAHYPSIHAYCRRRTDPGHVDDAVAETFLVAWRRIDDVPDGREALMWLYRVAHRVVGHQWRSSTRWSRLGRRVGGQRTPEAPGPAEHAVHDDECRRVLEAIDQLKPADSELLLLVAWEQLSTTDLAVVLDVTPNTASQRLSRARKQLASRFDRLDEPRTARRHDHPIDAPDALEGGAR
jgi:RNA polymerase sigma-70 factor (ECF subfamily)